MISATQLELLCSLQCVPGPSGDEGPIADLVETECRSKACVEVIRWGDVVFAVKGRPRMAVFAHMDTTGFTQGYRHDLIPIGGPDPKKGDRLRSVDDPKLIATVVPGPSEGAGVSWRLAGKHPPGQPGSRWVYADPLEIRRKTVRGPYLDNRAGVWNALQVLASASDVAVCFTVGEEHSGRGARIGARWVYEELGITAALISDVTWHTEGVRSGKGPAITLRDSLVPRRRFLDQLLKIADESAVKFQREVERSGGSDGSVIERSGYPIDWVFIGPPERRTHTSREVLRLSDLAGTVELYLYLLSRQGEFC